MNYFSRDMGLLVQSILIELITYSEQRFVLKLKLTRQNYQYLKKKRSLPI